MRQLRSSGSVEGVPRQGASLLRLAFALPHHVDQGVFSAPKQGDSCRNMHNSGRPHVAARSVNLVHYAAWPNGLRPCPERRMCALLGSHAPDAPRSHLTRRCFCV